MIPKRVIRRQLAITLNFPIIRLMCFNRVLLVHHHRMSGQSATQLVEPAPPAIFARLREKPVLSHVHQARARNNWAQHHASPVQQDFLLLIRDQRFVKPALPEHIVPLAHRSSAAATSTLSSPPMAPTAACVVSARLNHQLDKIPARLTSPLLTWRSSCTSLSPEYTQSSCSAA